MKVKENTLTTHPHILYPLFLLLFLTVGVFVAVNQTQNTQNSNSHAETATTTNCTISSSQMTVKAQEEVLLGEINLFRVQNNVDHLIWSSSLKQPAAWLSKDMLAHNTLNHVDSLHRTPDIRLANCGYNINNGYGEAIANGTTDPTVVFNLWKNDPAHKQILLNAKYNIAAIDVESDSSGKSYWTMDFGASSSLAILTPTQNPTSPTNTPTQAGNSLSPTSPVTTSTSPGISVSPSVSQNPNEPTPTPAPVTADMQIAVRVQINGIGKGGNVNPVHKTRRVTALIYGVGAEAVTTGTGFLIYDGSNYFTGTIHLGKLSQGAYFIKLVGDNTLQVLAKPEFQNLIVNQVNQIPPVTLYQGDINADNVLDINDYNLVLPCFQDKNCQTANAIDFNDDGKTDVTDYNLLLQSFEVLHGN